MHQGTTQTSYRIRTHATGGYSNAFALDEIAHAVQVVIPVIRYFAKGVGTRQEAVVYLHFECLCRQLGTSCARAEARDQTTESFH